MPNRSTKSRRAVRHDGADESLRILLHGQGSRAAPQEWLFHHQHGVEDGTLRLEASARLLRHQGRDTRFTKSLAANLIDKGIRVNVVVPGPVWTPLNPADRGGEEVAEFGANTEMKRPAQPEEIAPAFVFLAAPSCSSYITGIELPILGGTAG
jgi:hypothetical protein